jgi:hypothetical protein
LLPTGFTYNNGSGAVSVVISADKESQLYVENKASPGKYNPNNGNNNIQTIQTPGIPSNDPTQGYWASPAYWRYSPDGVNYTYMLYYSVDAPLTTNMSGGKGTVGVKPTPINGYQLNTTPPSLPIPSTPLSTPTLFCHYAPTPSVSSNGTTPGSGIVWAIEENQNSDNQGGSGPDCAGSRPTGNPAALHGFNATTMAEIYSSRTLVTKLGPANGFPTPSVFNGQVYVGTNGLVNVFGLCGNPSVCLH